MKRLLFVILTALLLNPVRAEPFDEGLTAFSRKDYEVAVRLIRLAADQGHGLAQTFLGSMYYEGRGVVQDYAEAIKWFRRNPAQKNADVQNTLGFMYKNGKGVVQDYAEAAKWYRLSAAQGNKDAQMILGAMYASGKGVIQNFVRAHLWLNIAAVSGDADAVKLRDLIAQQMTPQQIEEAQKLALECERREFMGCN